MHDLRRHVPPIALGWDDEAPGTTWRVLDGTLVFADVSGFTALTERLSRRGRIGAEDIVETLNGVFSPMIGVCACRGGELLKFGGDALLFLFRGPDHAEQACDAAVEMRSGLARAREVTASGGRLRLSMSVGVHTGDLHLFLVGSPTRELLVLGPGASNTARAEKAAGAGEIVLSPGTVARLGQGASRPRADGALLLRRRRPRSTPGSPTPVPEATAARLATLFPHALGAHLAPGPPDPEHRTATIAFASFCGTDAVLAEHGPQVLADRLDEVVGAVEDALAPEGLSLLATDLDTDGGKLFLGSGVPVSQDDDEGRMLRALRRIAATPLPLALRLGVNRGHVFAAEVGSARRAAYSAMGDTTNTAARIMSVAPPGVLYAHPDVLAHSRTTFATTPAGPFTLKGKAEPLQVLEVGPETGTRVVADDARLPLLGRDSELHTVREVLSRALGGDGGVVVVRGGAGLGKSRLVAEALASTPQARTAVLRGEPYGVTSTYRVLRDPMRALLGVLRDAPEPMGAALLDTLRRSAPDLVPLAPLLADVVQAAVPTTPDVERIAPEFRADRVADTVIEVLDRLVVGPFVVVVDDAQWVDGASAHLLGRVATATAGRPWALVCVRRGSEGGLVPEHGTEVDLAPLPDEVVERLVHAATESSPLRPHEAEAVVARAAGSPLYVAEVTRLAADLRDADGLPDSVQAAMTVQIDRLPPRHRALLRRASVLGRSVRREILTATLAADGVADAASLLDDLPHLLAADGTHRVRFRNSLVRDAAYAGLAYRTRARLHRIAGEVLESMSTDPEADSPALGLHFAQAGDAARTWRYSRLAGDLARRSYANADAAGHYETALGAAGRLAEVPDAERAALWTLVGETREQAGMFEEAVTAHRRAARLLRADPVAVADSLVRQANVHNRAGDFTRTLRVVARARRLLAGHEEDGRVALVRLDNLTALARLEQERPREAARWAERAVARAREVGDHETLVRSLMLVDGVNLQLGVPGPGGPHLEALAICETHGLRPLEATIRGNLGALAYYAGRWSEAATWYATSREVAQETGKSVGAAETGVNLGELLVDLGDLDGAEAVLTEAVRVLRAAGELPFVAQGQMQLARVALARGEVRVAERLAESAARRLADLGSASSALEAELVRAEALTRDGRPEEALDVVDAAERTARGESVLSLPRTCLQRARALLAAGRATEAAAVGETGLESARSQDLPYEEALLLRVAARVHAALGDTPGAERAAADSARILERLGVTRPGG